MMIKNVTDNWQNPKAGKGLYVLRSLNRPHRGVVRVGVAGIAPGRNGTLFKRLKRHLNKRTGLQTCATHECNPFELIYAWQLDDWLPVELASAEHCLYRGFAVKFRRRTGGLRDKSLFLVPEGCDLEEVLKNVGTDLHAIENLRPRKKAQSSARQTTQEDSWK